LSTTAGITNSWITVERIAGPAQIAASETVSFSANTSTTVATSGVTAVVFTTKDHDTHNAYSTSTGKFTAPMSGKYHFYSTLYSTTTSFNANFYKNGTVIASGINVAASAHSSVNFTVSMLAGDTMEVRPIGSITLGGGGNDTNFSGFRIGL